MRIEKVKISKLKLNPQNPRFIRDESFEKLKNSLKEFPEMLELREIIVDENFIILGGNMRYRALKELGEKECIVKIAEGLTAEQKREFIIKDNVAFGDWDFDALNLNYDIGDLARWGVELGNINYDQNIKEKEVQELETNNECPKCGYKY